jgi:GT2 family glycosyltransferase
MDGSSTSVIRNHVSIVVATYNRAQKLAACLQGLQALRLPEGLGCELICVDNNSSDATKAEIARLGDASPIPIVYVFEGRQGLARARNAGLRHARGEIIAMTDDDCIVDPDWIAEICKEFAADPALGLVGGRIELYDALDLPLTIRTSRERQRLDLPSTFRLIFGCNMAIRRSTFDRIGVFDPHFGAGSSLQSVEDSDLIYRTAKAGFGVVYCPNILVYHHHGRRTERERDKHIRSCRVGRGAFYAKYIFQNDHQVIRLAYWEIRALLRDIIRNLLRLKAASVETKNLLQVATGMLAYPWVVLRSRRPSR